MENKNFKKKFEEDLLSVLKSGCKSVENDKKFKESLYYFLLNCVVPSCENDINFINKKDASILMRLFSSILHRCKIKVFFKVSN